MGIRNALIVGGGIAGLTSAIALRRKGVAVDIVEIDPDWAVYGVGIIQQSNVVRAMAQLGLVDKYLDAAFAFDHIDLYDVEGRKVGSQPLESLTGEKYPAGLGVSRPALHEVLGSSAKAAGARIRLGVSVTALDAELGNAAFSDGSKGSYDVIVGADGLYSRTREMIFPDAPKPKFSGQAAWRYNFPRLPDVDAMYVVVGAPRGSAGLVPLADDLMYMYVTSEEPGNPRMPKDQLAPLMRERARGFGGLIGRLRETIVDSAGVVYRPMESVLVPPPWSKGRVVLIGDAAHATTPHLGQGAGMAIEDSIVLAEEITRIGSHGSAFARFVERRWERCKFIVEASLAIGDSEMRKRDVDRDAIFAKMFDLTSQPV